MKKYFLISFLSVVLAGDTAFAGNAPSTQAQAREWVRSRPVKFLENRGQMMDAANNPVPYVLFKSEAPGMNMYVTEKGLTYLFIKPEEERNEKKRSGSLIPLRDEREGKVKWSRIDMELSNASIRKENIVKENQSEYFNQYFLPQCPRGITDVREYEKIIVKNVYPGIDWVLYNSSKSGFKYDFIVHPGANASDILLAYRSKNKLKLNDSGNIFVETRYGNLSEDAPVSFYEGENILTKFKIVEQKKININGDNGYATSLRFVFPSSDFSNLSSELVIDPVLSWATFYGGLGADGPLAITTDAVGNVFIDGYVSPASLPVLNPGGGAYFQGSTSTTSFTGFIAKFSNAGALLWATLYGGTNGGEQFNGIACDAAGNVFVTGWSYASNFPTLNPGGGAFFQSTNAAGNYTPVIVNFSNSGVLVWATYLGSGSFSSGWSAACDASGNVFISGQIDGWIPTQNPGGGAYFQTANAGNFDSFIMKFSNAGVLIWGTYFGGNGFEQGWSISCDGNGNVLATGHSDSPNFPTLNPGGGAYFQGATAGGRNVFIAKFTNAGVLTWSTFYGGSGGDDQGYSILADGSGNIFVTGMENSTNFPTLNPGGGAYFQGTNGGNHDAFLLKFSPSGVLLWGTYYGGSGEEHNNAAESYDNLAIDACGTVYMSFQTSSNNLLTLSPCDGGYIDNSFNGGYCDFFLTRFSNTGVQLWATYWGGDGSDARVPVAVDPTGNFFVSGEWAQLSNSSTYPCTNPGGGAYYQPIFGGTDDGHVAKFLCQGLSACGISCNPCSNVLNIVASATNISCNGQCNGTASANPVGGTSPYIYQWSNTQTTQNISGLCAGNYSVLITDAVLATASATVAVTQPPVLTASVSATNSSCGNNNGSASVTAGGGTPGYTYSWSPSGGTAATASNLGTGTYAALVTDSKGCTQTATVVIIASNGPSVTATSTPQSCSQAGTATVNTSGGTSPYTYNWGNGQSTSTATGLSSGNYSVTITDATGCTTITTVSVSTSGNIPVAMATATPTGCANNNGTATANVSGGSSPYTYNWNPGGQTSATATGLAAGNYSVIITDATGCSTATTVSVGPSGNIPVATATATPSGTCSSSGNGTATANATGGSGPYAYLWSNGGTTSQISNLTSQIYTVTVTDALGCSAVTTVSVSTSANVPSVTAASTAASCNGSDGAATATGSGGTPPYTYSWSNGGTTSQISNLTSQIYSVTVTDGGGCTALSTVSVSSGPGPAVSVASDVTITFGQSASLTASGGGSYLWSTGASNNPLTVSPSATTIYCVTVIDANNCSDTACATVTIEPLPCSDVENLYIPNAFSPNGDGDNDVLKLFYANYDCIKTYKLIIYNRWGQKVFESENAQQAWDGSFRDQEEGSAVFAWYLRAQLLSGKKVERKGNVSLIR